MTVHVSAALQVPMTPLPGWYRDPEIPLHLRWWTGEFWTDRVVVPDPRPVGRGGWALALGIIGALAWYVPVVALILSATAIVLGRRSRRSRTEGVGTAGFILGCFGILSGALALAMSFLLGLYGIVAIPAAP